MVFKGRAKLLAVPKEAGKDTIAIDQFVDGAGQGPSPPPTITIGAPLRTASRTVGTSFSGLRMA